MDINKPDAAGLKQTKPTFKCLTNTGHSSLNTVHIKNRFNKLTLSSSNKKKPSQNERSIAVHHQTSDDTTVPTPKMLTYSSGSSDSSDVEDDHNLGEKQLEPIAKVYSSNLVNRLLESSSSAAASGEKEVPNDLALLAPNVILSCEAPSFSQRLEITDADETHCTLPNDPEMTGNSVFHADTIIGIQPAKEDQKHSNNTMYNNMSLGTEMERLQITASSEDLFEECSSAGKLDNKNLSSSGNIPMAQSVNLEVAISDISKKLEQIDLQKRVEIEKINRRETIMTISSSQSSPEKPAQLSTRSSLASEDVYDVITLSDSDAGTNTSVENVQPPLNNTSPAVHYNLSSVHSKSIGPGGMGPDSSDLSSLAQNRLDRFFDNIPLLSSEEPENKTHSTKSSPSRTAVGHSSAASSIYISETDEEDEVEADAARSDVNHESEPDIAQDEPHVTIDISSDEDVSGNATPPQVPKSLSSELVPTTQCTPLSSSSKFSKKSSQPVVNISAKFQIRIQVGTPKDSSSDCSSSNNTSRRSSFSSDEPHKKEDTSVNKQTERMSQLVLVDSESKSDSNQEAELNANTKENILKPATSGSSTPRRDHECRPNSNETPKSKQKKPQLAKLKTPIVKSTAPPIVTNEDDIRYLSPPKTVNPSISKIVLDDADQRLLNELYGASWQTPDLLKKCVLRRRPDTEAKKSSATLKSSEPLIGGKNKISLPKETVSDSLDKGKPKVSKMSELRTSNDFSMFRKNIANHLDSTRIEDAMAPSIGKEPVQTREIEQPVVASPFFKKPAALISKSKSRTVSKPQTMAKPTNTCWKRIVDMDSDSELSDDTAAEITEDLSDKSIEPEVSPVVEVQNKTGRGVRSCRKIKKTATYSDDEEDDSDEYKPDDSDSNSEDYEAPISTKRSNKTNRSIQSQKSEDYEAPKSTKRCNKTNRSIQSQKSGELTYLDLTHAEVVEDEEHQAPDASAEDLEVLSKKLLRDFEFKKPAEFQHTPAPSSPFAVPTIPKTPATKTKRKLFTPYFDDIQQATDQIYQKHQITPPKNERLTIMDQNDDGSQASVQFRNGIPTFLLPKNKRVDDLLNDQSERLPLTPKTVENVKNSPKCTPKSQRKVKEVGTPKFPSTISEIPKTPNDKYGFLRSFDVHLSKNVCHPTALMFKEKFKAKKVELTSLLYEMFNQQIFGGRLDVPVTWNNKLKTTAGYCYSRRRMGNRTAAIDLSDKVITSGDRLRCTLIHELCHAATWIFNADRGHGATWKTWAAKSNAIFPDLPPIERCHSYDIEYKYTYQCTLCGAKSHAHSKSKKVELIRCAYCHGAIEIFLNKKDKDGVVCPTPVGKAKGFAAFVKETYKEFKEVGVSHAEVMQKLSAKYASLSADEKKKY